LIIPFIHFIINQIIKRKVITPYQSASTAFISVGKAQMGPFGYAVGGCQTHFEMGFLDI
jgi:hypothetical protein